MKKPKTLILQKFHSSHSFIFRKKLTDLLQDELLNIPDEQHFIEQAMRYVFTGSGKQDKLAESKAKKVVLHFLSDADPELYQSLFIEKVMGIRELPYQAVLRIEKMVKSDLSEINELIKRYESQEYITRFLKKNENPRSHEEKILHDYYKRCLAEREIMIEYLLNGIGPRALVSMQAIEGILGSMADFGRQLRERPYWFWSPFKEGYFDSAKIDDFWHRVRVFPMPDEEAAFLLYKKDKAQFYRRFFKQHSVPKVFQFIHFYLHQLPINEVRKPIFTELQKLFKSRMYIGFYALALTQIEGIFGEMIRAIGGNIDGQRSALPDKVQKIRQHHHMSDYYFDYFQYQVPRLRNKFAHSGYDEDLKIKSYDLLLDLAQLLKIFDELKNPLVKIKRLIQKRDFENFINYKDFGNYFKLLEELLPAQKKEMSTSILDFEKEFLMSYTDIDYICVEVYQAFPAAFSAMKEKLEKSMKDKPGAIDLDNTRKDQMKTLLSDETILTNYADAIETDGREAYNIAGYCQFLSGYRKHLPSLKAESKNLLDELSGPNAQAISCFLSIYEKVLASVKITDWG